MVDAKFDCRYDVTKPLVLDRIRQYVSAAKCVAGMISPPRHHTSCSHKIISATLPSQTFFTVLACPGLWNSPVTLDHGTCPKSRLLQHNVLRPGPWRFCVFGSPSSKRTLFLVGSVDRRDSQCIGRRCAGKRGRCGVSGQKHVHPNASTSRSDTHSSDAAGTRFTVGRLGWRGHEFSWGSGDVEVPAVDQDSG